MTAPLLVPVSAGELFDKLSILAIKRERIADAAKLVHVRRELEQLEAVAVGVRSGCKDAAQLAALDAELLAINKRLWDFENTVRAFARSGNFGTGFIEAAQGIYAGNDERAAVKQRINLLLGSDLVEAKDHGGGPIAGEQR